MASRYSKSIFIQPTRKIPPAGTDIPHIFKEFETIDNLAAKYYKDPTLGWVIMCANPDYLHEWAIPNGAQISIPFPLSRVWSFFGVAGAI